MSENDKKAEDNYFMALTAVFYSNNKAEFAKACRESARLADDQNMKEHYELLALQADGQEERNEM